MKFGLVMMSANKISEISESKMGGRILKIEKKHDIAQTFQ